MAVLNLVIAPVALLYDYLIVTASKNTAPTIEEAREVYPAGDLTSGKNAVIPETGDIDPGIYRVQWWGSADGISKDTLLAEYVNKAVNRKPISETRWYEVGGGRLIDPPTDQVFINDEYLDGKDVTGIFKEGLGRPLVPPTETTMAPEYNINPGGQIQLLLGLRFNAPEKVAITITYTKDMEDETSRSGLYEGVVTVSADNTTLTDEHRNKRVKLHGAGALLRVTMEDLGSLPDGRFYYFTSHAGAQQQATIKCQSGDSILFNSHTYTELSIGKGEFVRIEKDDTTWVVTLYAPGLMLVGERIQMTTRSVPNTQPEDGRLLDGDVWRRMYYELRNNYPASSMIITSSVTNVGYVHPSDERGKFVIHPSNPQFRLPDTRNMFIRGMSDFSASPAADVTRPVNQTGGYQQDAVGEHRHEGIEGDNTSHGSSSIERNGDVKLLVNLVTETGHANIINGRTAVHNQGGETHPKNVGEVWLRRL
ncbi:MAG TPA: hypothetical protein VK628_05075 [Flavitalea sp.]|nr:hypothetical protein [Flavitalea sp.]